MPRQAHRRPMAEGEGDGREPRRVSQRRGGDRSHGSSRRRNHHDNDGDMPPPATSNANGEKKKFRFLAAHGESGRRGFNPVKFFMICFRSASKASMLCNLLWPVVPVALAVRYSLPSYHNLVFTLSYIAMVPCANLIGFAGQEFSRKFSHVCGILIETTCGSIVEIVLFINLLQKNQFDVIKAAILGSILATMLLCLGLCFFAGGLKREEQEFNEAISEAGSGLLLTAGVALAIPTIFRYGLPPEDPANLDVADKVLSISRIVSILLIIAYCVYVMFQAHSHHGIYNAVYEFEHADHSGHAHADKEKLTMTECIVAMVFSIALVTLIAITLVGEIEHVIQQSTLSEAFVGLILVPLVEKFAEHLTAVDEAWDNQMNFALSNVLGATLQTALFNAPLTVLVGWGLHKHMDLDFAVFNLVMLILSILTVGRFLQDQKSNYLEGSLLVILYVAIAVSSYYFPNPLVEPGMEPQGSEEEGHGGAVERSLHMAMAMAGRR